ncbi:MAG: type I restriction-modification system subunit M N-terminal domain-containing protein [Desulfohalobiaceae bacterium]|nr:type I restriction-modification system subunit M N-terminal domain-containing protein [Desulfohalobiaceae bacterium]
MTVLRRLDCVLAPTKEHVLHEYDKLQTRGLEGEALFMPWSKISWTGSIR